jgi:hypothetical protein
MLFWHVNEIIEPVSGMPAPQFGDESSWVWGSELVQDSSGSRVSFWLTVDGFAYLRLQTNVAEDGSFHNNRSEDLKPYLYVFFSFIRHKIGARGLNK